MLTDARKAELVEESRLLWRRLWPADAEEAVRETRACVFHTVALQALLYAREDMNTMLQAGTCQWPTMLPEHDDGVSATHFSYAWQGMKDARTRVMVAMGQLPEVHAWLAHRDPDTMIDPTTGTWPDRAREGGYAWRGPTPPPFLWHTTEQVIELQRSTFPLGITYMPDLEACQVVSHLAAEEIYPKIARHLGVTFRTRAGMAHQGKRKP